MKNISENTSYFSVVMLYYNHGRKELIRLKTREEAEGYKEYIDQMIQGNEATEQDEQGYQWSINGNEVVIEEVTCHDTRTTKKSITGSNES